MTTRYRLKEIDPLYNQLQEIADLMEKYGLSFDVHPYDGLQVLAKKDGKTIAFTIKEEGTPTNNFPPMFEWYLSYEKE